MTKLMYDAIDPSSIPPSAALLAGYINGNPKWQSYYPMVAGWPHATVLSITVKAYNSDNSFVVADILDVENGDALPTDAPKWTVAMRALSRPVITPYCSRLGTWPDTLAAFKSAKVPLPDFWIADQTNTPHLVPGSVATQYTDAGPYDLSLTNGYWPLSSPVPSPTPPPITTIQVGKYMRSLVGIPTDANGNGWLPTPIPFATFAAATIQGSDPSPTADDAYWPGTCKVQNRDGMVLVSVVGCLPKIIQNVFVLTDTTP